MGCKRTMRLKDRIVPYVKLQDWTGLTKMLNSLSNMELRRTEHVVREEVLSDMGNGLFWETLLHLIIYKRPAYLSGVRAVGHLAEDGTLDFKAESVKELYEFLKEKDPASAIKICDMMLPKLKTEEQIDQMWEAFHVDGERTRLRMLLKLNTPLILFMIFKTLKRADDKKTAQECCMSLAKRNDDMAFNAACIIGSYFGLTGLPMRFSLKIEPYELSHLDRNFGTFSRMLMGKRPEMMR